MGKSKTTGKTNKRKVKGPTAATKKRKEENPTAQTGEGPTGLPQKSWCLVHPQVPPLFCQDDSQCFCVVCDLSVHKFHMIQSEEEAEKRLKEPLQTELHPLKQQRQSYEDLMQKYDHIQKQCEEQAQHCERQINAVFDRMQRHLNEQKKIAKKHLKQEQDRQSHLLTSLRKSLTDKLSPVNNKIQQLEKHLQTPTRDFLLNLRPSAGPSGRPLPTGLRQDQAKAPLPTGLMLNQAKAPLPTGLMLNQAKAPLPTGLMLDQAKVLRNLGFRVWRSLRRAVQNKPILLDLNTANPWLHLSEDLSGVTHGDTYQHHFPDIPERFSKYPTVLGSEGFSSGTHQWDVEVGDHPDWNIGVAKESVDRKGERPALPQSGIWCLCHRDGKYTNCFGEILKVKKSPDKIRVRLDYNRGTVFFSDTDPITLLCTYTLTHPFSEKMFPYFCIGESKDAKTKEIRISETPDEV